MQPCWNDTICTSDKKIYCDTLMVTENNIRTITEMTPFGTREN